MCVFIMAAPAQRLRVLARHGNGIQRDATRPGPRTRTCGGTFDVRKALLAPCSAPRVLDDPDVHATHARVADNQHSMVQVPSTRGGRYDATGIELPALRINSCNDWALCHCRLQGERVVCSDASKALHLNADTPHTNTRTHEHTHTHTHTQQATREPQHTTSG